MRCKPNELAVISRTSKDTRDFHGRFIKTVRLAQQGDFDIGNVNVYGPCWVVAFNSQRPKYPAHDHHLPATIGLWPDAWLRPIRDDGSLFDETMFWTGARHARA
jgi:hypothetical protein